MAESAGPTEDGAEMGESRCAGNNQRLCGSTWSSLVVDGEACGEKARRGSRGALARGPTAPCRRSTGNMAGVSNSLPGQQAGGQGLRRTPPPPPSRQQTAAQAHLK